MADTGPTAQNHALLDVPFHGFWLVDADGNSVFANATLAQLLGGEISPGASVIDRVAANDRDDFQAITATLELGVSDEMDLTLTGDHGEAIPVRAWLSPRVDAGGTYDGYMAIVQDRRDLQITDPKQLLEAGQVTQYLTAGVAHSLNTSLQAVLGYAGLVLDDSALADSLKGPMSSLYDASRAATRLVTHLLSLTELGDDIPAAIGIGSVLHDAVSSREAYLIANNVTVIRNDLDEECFVWASPPKLRRAMSHLLTNASALALAHGGGTIDVIIDAGIDTVVLGLETRGHQYPDAIVHFDPASFSPTLPQAVMTHALAAGLLRAIGGRVEVVNTETGARVLVSLPRASAEAVAQNRESYAPVAAGDVSPAKVTDSGVQPRVLVVDDELFILELSERALEDLCEVTTVSSADAAQVLLADEAFDLVVTDLRMPGALDGLGLYGWATEHRPEVAARFVFTTADTVSRQAAEFLMSSGRPYLQKPFDVRNYRRFISSELA
jgi:signal transduction histidine kinase/CheY-like chemotaxis protein